MFTYSEKFLKIRSKTAQLIPLKANTVQCVVHLRKEAWKKINPGRSLRALILKARQGGVTTWEQALSFHRCATRPYQHAVTLAHTADSVEKIYEMVRLFYRYLPPLLRPHMKRENRRVHNFDRLNSQFYVGSAGSVAFGRGTTIQRAHCSEVAFWTGDVQDTMAGILEAAAQGEVVCETTANGTGGWFHQTWTEAEQGANEWCPIFIPWWVDPTNTILLHGAGAEIRETLTDHEKDLINRHRLTTGQLAWRRDKLRSLKQLFAQEYPETATEAFLSSGTCFFNLAIISALMQQAPDPAKKHLPGGYEVRWEPPQKGVQYAAGCDTSEGLPGCDRSGVGLLRKDTGACVAALHGLFSPRVLADHCVRICREYNNALLGVERENHGHAVIQKIQDLGYGQSHYMGGSLFYHKLGREGTTRPGWHTNAETRAIMLDRMAEALEEGTILMRDREFLSEALSFRLQPSGKFEADQGTHDDAVIKWSIANMMRQHHTVTAGVLTHS